MQKKNMAEGADGGPSTSSISAIPAKSEFDWPSLTSRIPTVATALIRTVATAVIPTVGTEPLVIAPAIASTSSAISSRRSSAEQVTGNRFTRMGGKLYIQKKTATGNTPYERVTDKTKGKGADKTKGTGVDKTKGTSAADKTRGKGSERKTKDKDVPNTTSHFDDTVRTKVLFAMQQMANKRWNKTAVDSTITKTFIEYAILLRNKLASNYTDIVYNYSQNSNKDSDDISILPEVNRADALISECTAVLRKMEDKAAEYRATVDGTYTFPTMSSIDNYAERMEIFDVGDDLDRFMSTLEYDLVIFDSVWKQCVVSVTNDYTGDAQPDSIDSQMDIDIGMPELQPEEVETINSTNTGELSFIITDKCVAQRRALNRRLLKKSISVFASKIKSLITDEMLIASASICSDAAQEYLLSFLFDIMGIDNLCVDLLFPPSVIKAITFALKNIATYLRNQTVYKYDIFEHMARVMAIMPAIDRVIGPEYPLRFEVCDHALYQFTDNQPVSPALQSVFIDEEDVDNMYKCYSLHGHTVLADVLFFDLYFATNPSDYPCIPIITDFELTCLSKEFRVNLQKYNQCFTNLFTLMRANMETFYATNHLSNYSVSMLDVYNACKAIVPNCKSIDSFPYMSPIDRAIKFTVELWKAVQCCRANSDMTSINDFMLLLFIDNIAAQPDNVFRFWMIALQYRITNVTVKQVSTTDTLPGYELHISLFAQCAFCTRVNQVAYGKVYAKGVSGIPVLEAITDLTCRCNMPDIVRYFVTNSMTNSDIPVLPVNTKAELCGYSLGRKTTLDTRVIELMTLTSNEAFTKLITTSFAVPPRETGWYLKLDQNHIHAQLIQYWAHKYLGVQSHVHAGVVPFFLPFARGLVTDGATPKHILVAMAVGKINETLIHKKRNVFIDSFLQRLFLNPNTLFTCDDLTILFIIWFMQLITTRVETSRSSSGEQKVADSVELIGTTFTIVSDRVDMKLEQNGKPFYSKSEDYWAKKKYMRSNFCHRIDITRLLAAYLGQNKPGGGYKHTHYIPQTILGSKQTMSVVKTHLDRLRSNGITIADRSSTIANSNVSGIVKPPVKDVPDTTFVAAQNQTEMLQRNKALQKELQDTKEELSATKEVLDDSRQHRYMYMCKLCNSETAVWALDKCKHVISCDECHKQYMYKDTYIRKCMVCRTPIDLSNVYVRIYG